MSTIQAVTRGGAALLIALAAACGKKDAAVDTLSVAAGAPAVAVTTEIVPGVLMTVDAGPGMGVVLTDGAGRAMYILDAVPADTSTWKPVSGNTTPTSTDAKVNRSLIGTTTNANGTKQATYAGKPLYYYSGDTTAGDTKGQGVTASGATGHLVNPEGNAVGANK